MERWRFRRLPLVITFMSHLHLALAGTIATLSPVQNSACTARCSNMNGAINWACDQTTDGETLCNTIDLQSSSCHYHFYERDEVGKCMNDRDFDIIFLGASYSQGLTFTTFPWWDPTIQGEDKLDTVKWIGLLESGYTYDAWGFIHQTDLLAGQVNVDRDGKILWKGGTTWGATSNGGNQFKALFAAADGAGQSGNSAMTFLKTSDFTDANTALDELAAAGRADRKTYLVMSIGAWWFYCYQYKGSYCDTTVGPEVEALGSDYTAVLLNLQNYYTTFIERVQKDFPNYIIVTSDYAWDHSQSDMLPGLSNLMKELGDTYGHFLNIYDQAMGDNAPPEVGGHPVHASNMASFQRLLSVACKGTSIANVECDEKVAMSSTCQYYSWLDTYTPAGEELQWEYQWQRPCDFESFKSFSEATVPTPTPAPAASSTKAPVAPTSNTPTPTPTPKTPTPTSTGGGSAPTPTTTTIKATSAPDVAASSSTTSSSTSTTGGSTSGGSSSAAATSSSMAAAVDESQIVLETDPVSAYPASGSSGSAATLSADGSSVTSSSSDTNSDAPVSYQAWRYSSWQYALAACSLAVTVYIFWTRSPYHKHAVRGEGSSELSLDKSIGSKAITYIGRFCSSMWTTTATACQNAAKVPGHFVSDVRLGCCGCCIGSSGADDVVDEEDGEGGGAAAAVAGTGKAGDDWGYLGALDGARFLASLSIVMGHYANHVPTVVPDWNLISYGFTWVPFFMMLSGFVLTYTSLKRQSIGKTSKSVDPLQFLFARVMSIYPLYILGVLIAAAIAIHDERWPSITWLEMWCSVTLTQAWVTKVTENVLQQHCWFLSAILPYWYFHNRIESFFARLRPIQLWASMGFIVFLGWLPAIIPPLVGVREDWYTAHTFGSFYTWLDILVIMLKYSPFFYGHIYSFGVGLACIYRNHRKQPPLLFRYGALIGYAGLGCLFCFKELQLPAHKLTCRLGALAPLQGLLLIGLGMGGGHDPVTMLLGTWPFRVLGSYSYAQYVMQFIAMNIWDGWADLGMLCFLLALSMLTFHISTFFFGDKGDKQKFVRGAKLSTFLFLTALCVWGLVPEAVTNEWLADAQGDSGSSSDATTASTAASPYSTPAYVSYSSGAYDVRLNLTTSELLGGSDVYDFINPSLLQVENVLYVAARRHRLEFATPDETYNGLPLMTNRWYSDIVFGMLDPTTLAPLGDVAVLQLSPVAVQPGMEYVWTPCAQAPVDSGNGTYTQQVVTGPQDPRLFLQADGKLVLSFFSTTPEVGADGYCDANATTIGHMYLTQGDLRDAQSISTGVIATVIPSSTTSDQLYEKNWMAFDVASSEQINGTSTIGWLEHLSPFMATKTVNGANVTAYEVKETALDYVSAAAQVEVHGGSNAVYVKKPFTDAYNLIAFHTLDAESTYINYLMKFTAEAPYYPTAISRPLPLISRSTDELNCPIFVSGLTLMTSAAQDSQTQPVEGDLGVIVSFGSCDEEARALYLGWTDVDVLFTHDETPADVADLGDVGVVGVGGVELDEEQQAADAAAEAGAGGAMSHYFTALMALLALAVVVYGVVLLYRGTGKGGLFFGRENCVKAGKAKSVFDEQEGNVEESKEDLPQQMDAGAAAGGSGRVSVGRSQRIRPRPGGPDSEWSLEQMSAPLHTQDSRRPPEPVI